VRFWDASGIVPLLLDEPGGKSLEVLLEEDPDVLTWWGTEVECISAVRRRERDGTLDRAAVEVTLASLSAWREEWSEVAPTDEVRRLAARILATHPLRSGDALQIAAAVQAAAGRPGTLPFVVRDKRLADAASKEGFRVVG